MVKKLLLVLAVVILAGAAVVIYFVWKGPDLSQYDHLVEPAISTKQPQKMFVVEAKGDPNVVGQQVFELLYNLYYNTEGAPAWPLPAPRARWPVSPDQPKEEWIGLYGIPVPDTVMDLPDYTSVPGMTVTLTTWTYGEVAELLYIGPYEDEPPAIQRLENYVNEQGYAFNGLHEEEYLKGPGMFFRGNPEEYVTILRYEISPVMDRPSDEAGVVLPDEAIAEPSNETIVEED